SRGRHGLRARRRLVSVERMMIWIVASGWMICAVVTSIIAGSRDRNPFAWLAIGAAIGVFGLILVLALPAARPPRSPAAYHPLIGAGRKHDMSKRDCPDCHEPVAISTARCPHCGFRLS